MKRIIKICIFILLLMLSIAAISCSDDGGSNNQNSNNPSDDNQSNNTCEHSYVEAEVVESTCAKEGSILYFCSKCENTYTITTQKKEHTYTSEITTQATCGQKGVETFSCSNCNDSYTSDIPKLNEHTYSRNNVCKGCGKNSTITLSMTKQEKEDALKVKYARIKWIYNSDCIEIKFTHQNTSDTSDVPADTVVTAPFIFDYVITDVNGNIVDSNLIEGKSSDYSMYKDAMWVTIKIPYSNLTNTTAKLDKIYCTSYNPGYFMRGEVSSSIPFIITLPELPKSVSYDKYSGDSVLKITDITYEKSSYTTSIYLSGEVIYYTGKANLSEQKAIGYKIYDRDGVVIKSGTAFTSSVTVNEKFKNVEIYLSNSNFEAGEIYRLELINVEV